MTTTSAPRCATAHVADPRGCEGQRDAVSIVDQTGAGVAACLLHGTVLLASLDRGRVYPLIVPQGSAIVVHAQARELPPFDFLTGPGVNRVETIDEAAVFPYAPEPTLPGTDASAIGRRSRATATPQHRGAGSRQPARGQRLDASGTGSVAAGNDDGNGWSGPGNARSSRWLESCVSRLRGNA